mgnify:CR=1 FL=1
MAFSVPTKNVAINCSAVTSAADGDGTSGFIYGDAEYLYRLKTTLVSLGWTVTVSSTRTSGTLTDATLAATLNRAKPSTLPRWRKVQSSTRR